MTEFATIDWFGRWGASVFSENTAIFSIIFILLIKYIWICHYIFKRVNLVLIMKPLADSVYYEGAFSRQLT